MAIQLAMFGFGVAAAQTIPPTPPTTAPAPPALVAAPSAESSKAAQRATVTFTGGTLSVAADNSSLNQILRDIARMTGMKITGGVKDERVYGSFGPGDTSTVLSALLSGTGSNMMLIFDAKQSPSELVLTPRGGGPTPPSPMAARGNERDEEDLPPQMRQHIPRPEPRSEPAPAPAPVAAPAPTPAVPAAPAAADTTQQVSPNGVSTPEQIYQQLMQMKAKQQTPGATPP